MLYVPVSCSIRCVIRTYVMFHSLCYTYLCHAPFIALYVPVSCSISCVIIRTFVMLHTLLYVPVSCSIRCGIRTCVMFHSLCYTYMCHVQFVVLIVSMSCSI